MNSKSSRRVPVAIALVAAAGLCVTGIGVAPPVAATPRTTPVVETPQQIIAAAKAATLAATNVTVNAIEEIKGQQLHVYITGRYPTYVQLAVAIGGASAGVIVHGATTYFEGSAQVWTSSFRVSARAAATLAGKWYVARTSDPLIGSVAGINPKAIERSLFATLGAIGGVRGVRARRVHVGARPAFVIGDRLGAVYVAARGKPFLLRITSNNAIAQGFEQFTGYDAPLRPKLPAIAGELDVVYAAAIASNATTIPAG